MPTVDEKLNRELKRLQSQFRLGWELKVKWMAGADRKLSGEVKGDTIYVYDEKEQEAIRTLRHEFLDYAVSRLIEPYKEVTNKLIALINEEAYKRKEKFIESLTKLLS